MVKTVKNILTLTIWPMPEVVDEVFRVVYVDGIWIARDCVVLIACSD